MLEALGLEAQARARTEEASRNAGSADEIPSDPASFRRPRGDLAAVRFHVAEPERPLLLLTRLGDPPGWKGTPILDSLGPLVEQAASKAREIALADADEPAER